MRLPSTQGNNEKVENVLITTVNNVDISVPSTDAKKENRQSASRMG